MILALKLWHKKLLNKSPSSRHTFIGFNFATAIVACIALFIGSDLMRNLRAIQEDRVNFSSAIALLVFVNAIVGICMAEVKEPPIFGLVGYIMMLTMLMLSEVTILMENIEKAEAVEVTLDDGSEFVREIMAYQVEGGQEREERHYLYLISISSALITTQIMCKIACGFFIRRLINKQKKEIEMEEFGVEAKEALV